MASNMDNLHRQRFTIPEDDEQAPPDEAGSTPGLRLRKLSTASGSQGGAPWVREVSGEEAAFHQERTELARAVMARLNEASAFDVADGADGLEPPSADVPDMHFNRRRLANEVLAAAEEFMLGALDEEELAFQKTVSCTDLGYLGKGAVVRPEVMMAMEQAVKERGYLMKAAAFGDFSGQRPVQPDAISSDAPAWDRSVSGPGKISAGFKRLLSGFSEVSHGLSQADGGVCSRRQSRDSFFRQLSGGSGGFHRHASVDHDHMTQLLKTDGLGMARLTPPSHAKPVLKDPMGLRCVAHLYDKKWTKLARAIRETIYDPEFYDDGTYGPMYVRLAIHGAATYDKHDGTGGLEGGAMRFKPEYSDAHNKFCKEIIKRQHELIKVPHPWASYADIQCLCSYVALECANGPVIPFTPGRRDVIPADKLNLEMRPVDYNIGKDDFVLLNYRERGDAGREDAPAMCPASGKSGDGCPFLTKMMVHPGRVPGPEQGFLGRCCQPVTKEMEKEEWAAVAEEIRHIFCHRMGASERHTVALIAGGHSLGRCHPQISGYAGPWQSNPGYFNNVYCKKLLSEDWKIVDRNMEDCSGDMITGLKPYGMRRQYVNKGGKGDLMMLVSDMVLLKDPGFGKWIRAYAKSNQLLQEDFKVAFKWVTELGFTPPEEKKGLAKVVFKLRKFKADALHWLGANLCAGGDFDTDGGSGGGAAAIEMPKVGKPFTLDEVKAHSSKTDCWVVINGQVCDLTKFMHTHPGGVQAIMDFAGTDASKEWNTIHTRNAVQAIAPETVIGHIVASKAAGKGAGSRDALQERVGA